MNTTLISFFQTAGGLALFLLAMQMMTAGLKAFAGGGLVHLLGRWTSTATRGVLTGMLVTAVVQSSSAVIVATLGFVNAGLLTLRQALGVVFGTNVGTTVTGWLVSLVGLGFKIEALALPLLAVGVLLRTAAPGRRTEGLGEALAGFGLFFLGLGMLREAFAGMAEAYGTAMAASRGAGGVWAFLAAGFVTTVLTQSSSAALALVLTAAAGGVIELRPAAAAVIGANLGTTSTAALAVLRATAAARRLALGHIGFNVVTAVVALLLLPGLLRLVGVLDEALDLEGRPAPLLALFHTMFNLLGVAILLPLNDRIARALERAFRTADEELARPRHLDPTLTTTPHLAVEAAWEELARLRALAAEVVIGAAGGQAQPVVDLARRGEAARALGAAVARFVATVRTGSMPREVADELAGSLRVQRYLDEAVRLTGHATALRRAAGALADGLLRDALERVLGAAVDCATLAGEPAAPASTDDRRVDALRAFREAYERAKAGLLRAAVAGALDVGTTASLLDDLAGLRRLVEQLVKGDRALRNREDDLAPETEFPAADAGSVGTDDRSRA